jgi:hypothetical protein
VGATAADLLSLTSECSVHGGVGTCYNSICVTFLYCIDDIAWMLKLHAESLARKERSKTYFSDRLCDDLKFCERVQDVRKAQQAEVEQVFW